MPFRASLKRVLTRKSSTTSSSSSTSSPTESSRRDSSIFQPGEMPLPKYRRPVDPAHKAMLDSFTFGTSKRRKSFSSQYSPTCTTLPSRRNSCEIAFFDLPPTVLPSALDARLQQLQLASGARSIDGDSTDSENDSMHRSSSTNSSIVSTHSSMTDVSCENIIPEDQAWSKEDLLLALRRSNLLAPQ